MRTLLEMWRVFASVGAEWDDMHDDFENLIRRRVNVAERSEFDDRQVEFIDRALINVSGRVTAADEALDDLLAQVLSIRYLVRAIISSPLSSENVQRTVRIAGGAFNALLLAASYQSSLKDVRTAMAGAHSTFPLELPDLSRRQSPSVRPL